MGKKILVLGDIRDGALRNVSFEAIAAAKADCRWRRGCCSLIWRNNRG